MTLTQGFSKICEARSGGMKRLFITNVDDIVTFTKVGDVYTSVTMEAGKVFFEIEFEEDTAERRENVVRENGSGKVTHQWEWFLAKLTAASREILQDVADASPCGMILIGEDNNSISWVTGYSENFLKKRPMKLLTDDSLSGKVFTDLNGSTVVVQSEDTEKDRQFTGTVPV